MHKSKNGSGVSIARYFWKRINLISILKPLPLVTIITTLIEVGYFVYVKHLPGVYSENILASPLLWRYENKSLWYIWITYSFCHGSLTHLLSNLFLKVFLGLFVEMEHKWLRVLIIYVLGVALGALFHSVVNPCSPLCGSSGGCYALLGSTPQSITILSTI